MYGGLLITLSGVLHLLVRVHAVSRGNLSVVTLTSTFIPVMHVVGGVVGLKLGLPIVVGSTVGWTECVEFEVG